MAIARGISSWLLAWLASAAFWMVLTDSVRLSEMLAGAAVAALGATGFEVVRRRRTARQALRPDLALRAWRVLVRVPADVVRLTRAAFAQVIEREPARGQVLALPFGHLDGDPGERARRAAAVGLGSVAPNTIVIGIDPETGMLLVHQLVPTGKPSDADPLALR
jgi:multisubunit Na+/H+ antiporter MnhE subunit